MSNGYYLKMADAPAAIRCNGHPPRVGESVLMGPDKRNYLVYAVQHEAREPHFAARPPVHLVETHVYARPYYMRGVRGT
jgi:hypothetical protein